MLLHGELELLAEPGAQLELGRVGGVLKGEQCARLERLGNRACVDVAVLRPVFADGCYRD